jgi:transcriptional regulator with XRE-family HTH domain
MESETVREGLKRYGIGGKLRRLRLRKSMGLLELSKQTGLSPALLSKLKRDVMHPTLPTLLRIALVFSVGLDYFFVPEPNPVFEIIPQKTSAALSGLPGFQEGLIPLRELGLRCAAARAELIPC